ncbi:hypothetical protein K443DRAFT_686155 [Laccaria amethystina LaAM-08-1]|uniref:Alfy-like armadillo-like repeat domain-containing protein n=1 Tax=Laccaria amethystina LaAM-08-1 TaxID=1095629 RepID=A0A0C9X436_9AGAR|nr:hypothetical protein K443DRAFT_686155 [Laccaria amethystina LaAM-08-1]
MAVTDDLSQVLVEIMLQVGATNNVFREMDGFLVLMSVLSTIQDHHQTQDDHTAAIETTRLVFVVLAEATTNHLENSGFFRNRLGYESLGIALQGLASDPQTVDETMGFLLSLALSDFSLSGLFTSIRGAQGDDLDVRLTEFQSRLGTIHRPEVIRILWDVAFRDTTSIRYGMFKLFEELSYVSHRNQGVLSALGLG